VLVVEDDEDAAQTMALLLRRSGHEVGVARDGLQALEAARTQHLDAVFLDLRLPGMDGHEVARLLRQQAGSDRPLLVAVTGDAAEQERPREESEFDEFLAKPVDPHALQEVLARSP
jgi:CheY-like chemotaxis protein